jgi:outer membrane protein assembly factor BamD
MRQYNNVHIYIFVLSTMKKIILTLPILALFMGGCVLKEGKKHESLTKGWSPKTFFTQAKDLMSSNSMDDAIELFKQLEAAYPSSKYTLQSKLEIAYALYKSEDYNQSIKRLNSYIKLYPNYPSTAYAYYLRGIVSEHKSRSILDDYITDNAQRDVASVNDAFNYYLELINKFPKTKYSEEAKKRLVILRNVLSRHELFVAIYYTQKGANIAAINRSKYIIEKYPNTPSVPAALHLMAHNYDIINTPKLAKDTRRVLKKSYPLYIPHYSLNN